MLSCYAAKNAQKCLFRFPPWHLATVAVMPGVLANADLWSIQAGSALQTKHGILRSGTTMMVPRKQPNVHWQIDYVWFHWCSACNQATISPYVSRFQPFHLRFRWGLRISTGGHRWRWGVDFSPNELRPDLEACGGRSECYEVTSRMDFPPLRAWDWGICWQFWENLLVKYDQIISIISNSPMKAYPVDSHQS